MIVNLPPWRRIPESVKCSMCGAPAVDYLATAFDWQVGKINGLSASEMLHGYVCDGCRDDLAQRFQRITGMTTMVTPVRWSWAQWREYHRMLYVDRRGRFERRLLRIAEIPTHIRVDVPALLTDLDQLRRENADLRGQIRGLRAEIDEIDHLG